MEKISIISINLMKKKVKTLIDFSNHILNILESNDIKIYEYKIPNKYMNSIIFIVGHGVTTVTGDFGNWVFSREFHPNAENSVSPMYWDEKLRIASNQKSHEYDPDDTLKSIKIFKKDYKNNYGRKLNDEENEWIEALINSHYDHTEYIYTAYREKPSHIDYEDIPYGEKRHIWLQIIYEAFDEMCNIYKKNLKTK